METWDLVGSVGVALILIAFVANLAGRLPGSSPVYQSLNAVGAGLACASSIAIQFWPFVVLEGVWCLVAGLALAKVPPFASAASNEPATGP
ncbi:MAG: CBU_0592 family membrane protein [Tepidiformaceae bacterium]